MKSRFAATALVYVPRTVLHFVRYLPSAPRPTATRICHFLHCDFGLSSRGPRTSYLGMV